MCQGDHTASLLSLTTDEATAGRPLLLTEELMEVMPLGSLLVTTVF